MTSMLASVFLFAMAVTSYARPICWIDHIAKAKGGIKVYFIQQAQLRIGINENSDGTSSRYTASNGVVHDDRGQVQDHLFVRDGVEFNATQLSHDSCLYRVSASEDVGKLTARSAMRLPGLDPVFTQQIIGTDGTVSD